MRMPKMPMLALLAAGLLAGCTTTAGSSSAPPPQSVDFAVTPCFGSCPDFSITLSADGQGVYNGGGFVKVKGTHRFTASPAEVQAVFARLAPFRPTGEVRYDYSNCPVPVSTDSPSVNVRWKAAAGEDALSWYRGCRVPALMKIKPELQDAWKELPLDELVGTAENRFEYQPRGG